MATANFWQRGETIDRTNSGSDTIEPGTIQVIGKRIGVVATRALPGAKYSVNVEGIYKFAKKTTEAITEGAEVYFDSSDSTITVTSGDRTILAGFAVSAADTADTTVLVKINA